ncbi:MAG: toll/interleukin-1 receptor domain-containing protein [Dysgonamonadaceae bacterium]|jgi:hypothetical protein|nr:toll/interleukin-1 receptor domain-containing protein [Dysgonamonadaceae bacterium]
MAILTKSKLSRIADSKAGYTQKSVILNESRSFSNKYSAKTSIFLSHSHYDSEYVKDAVVLLRKMGVEVYIDWMDDSMPKATSGQTATLLKQKIKENDKFVFLATNNSIESKWCNWEIGFGDACKYIDKIALLPLKDEYSEWKGNEYLQIYPYIMESDYTNDYYKVVYLDGKEKSLQEWLNS